jgi:hypothetical protein
MVAQQAARVRDSNEAVEEIYYRKGDIDFCFLLNRRHHNLRVFDYRVGNYQQKRDFFDRIARAEGLRKVFTVVEKQDSKSWRSVGFSREGSIPGYFRTADAYVMSRVYTEDGDPIQGGAPKLNAPNIAQREKTPVKPRGLSYEIVRELPRLQQVVHDLGEIALYAPFRRGVFTPDLGLRGRQGRREFWLGAETDHSFGHAKIDMLTPPEKEADVQILEFCLKVLIEELVADNTASVFAACAVDAPLSAQVYGELGFKVTARLTDHVTRGAQFVGAQLWHRRLTHQPSPRLPSFI